MQGVLDLFKESSCHQVERQSCIGKCMRYMLFGDMRSSNARRAWSVVPCRCYLRVTRAGVD